MENEKVYGLIAQPTNTNETVREHNLQTATAGLDGFLSTIATTVTLDTLINSGNGIFIVSDETNGASAIISFHDVAGVPTPTILAGDATITVIEDNALTINVFWDGGGTDTVKIQNNLAADADIRFKAYK